MTASALVVPVFECMWRRVRKSHRAHRVRLWLLVFSISVVTAACGGSQSAAPATSDVPVTVETKAADGGSEIVVYAADLPERFLYELEFADDPDAVGGKVLGLPNYGGDLDPPPEFDPNVTFPVQVQEGLAYRCWVHMKVGEPYGKSTANVVYVQISDAVDEAGNTILKPASKSYLTAQGPETLGWSWVGCDLPDAAGDSLIRFGVTGEVTVRVQAGMEGVGIDQFVLSSDRFLEEPPAQTVVEK